MATSIRRDAASGWARRRSTGPNAAPMRPNAIGRRRGRMRPHCRCAGARCCLDRQIPRRRLADLVVASSIANSGYDRRGLHAGSRSGMRRASGRDHERRQHRSIRRHGHPIRARQLRHETGLKHTIIAGAATHANRDEPPRIKFPYRLRHAPRRSAAPEIPALRSQNHIDFLCRPSP